MATRSRGRPSTGVREAVIASAQQVLAESGIARLSTKEIATRAGVAESSIFYHFGDRMSLLQAVIQHQLRPFKEMLADEPARDLRGELASLLATLEDFFLSALPIMAAVQSDAELRAVYRERSRDLDLGPHRAVDGVVAHLSARGVEVADLRTPALLLVGAAHQRALQRQLSPPDALVDLPSPDAIVEVVLPLFETKN
ncbi:TetR family transcriptional regulator [Nocardia sp. ET3-3]|uniref:TetR family transcriptional regulator n=1 Tax=Nocardia terrae TaxID=2675851 RepID=A0A7K1V092_9NOCA|nr:TetR/AcrR family transcriptional regulator [Nocardia terrae]MVU79951.1 TetR family transcriptional regulator [Nocardia terrae]